MSWRPSLQERRENRERMFDEAASAVATYGWYLTPFSKVNRPVKVLGGLLKFGIDSRKGVGGPSALTQPPPSSSEPSRQARASAQGGKSGAPARASTQGSRHRRKSCPKGHYWSYKHGKCMKSKYR